MGLSFKFLSSVIDVVVYGRILFCFCVKVFLGFFVNKFCKFEMNFNYLSLVILYSFVYLL